MLQNKFDHKLIEIIYHSIDQTYELMKLGLKQVTAGVYGEEGSKQKYDYYLTDSTLEKLKQKKMLHKKWLSIENRRPQQL